MSNTSDYGRFYWCAKVTKDLSLSGEIYVMADSVEILANGCIVFMRGETEDRPENTNLMIASGKWTVVYAASVLDGHAVAVEHWKGEVERE